MATTAKAEPGKGLSLSSGTSTRPDDLVAYFKPRIEGQPWTAPAYDSRPVVADPEVYCIAVDDGRCSCMTEQGTRYEMDKKICRSMAANGVYNPYRRPASAPQQGQQGSQANQPQQAPQDATSGAGASGGSTGWPVASERSPTRPQVHPDRGMRTLSAILASATRNPESFCSMFSR